VHVCFAWRIGLAPIDERYSDDGEPNNSAGKPIFGQLIKANLKNTLVAVVRYYGGTNLGVGGLISAYKTAAELAILNGKIIVKHEMATLRISFQAEDTGEIMIHANRSDGHILEHGANTDEHFILYELKKSSYPNFLANLNKTGKFNVQFKE
jgi:putative IMPACT (imprinted ancient) family translation regulator